MPENIPRYRRMNNIVSTESRCRQSLCQVQARAQEQDLAPKVPIRTCVGCRLTDAQAKLLRAVADASGRLRFDMENWRSPGRGCYVHQKEACMQAAARGGFERSLRRRLLIEKGRLSVTQAKTEELIQVEPPAQRQVRGHSNRDNS